MCNIPLWRTENTYYLRTLARKWSGPFLMLDLLYLIMMWLTDDMMCYYLMWKGAIDSVLLSVQGFWPWGCRGIGRTPLDSRLSQGVCFWFDIFTMMFHWLDDLMLTFLSWLLVMQADDSLPTWLTYGVKGTHTIAKRLRERGGQQPCHHLLALPSWLEL